MSDKRKPQDSAWDSEDQLGLRGREPTDPEEVYHKGDGTAREPNQWFHSGVWRDPQPWDKDKPGRLRRGLQMLSELGGLTLVPSGTITGDLGWNTWEANHRAELHVLADDLSCEDLWTVFRVAQLLHAGRQAGNWAGGQPGIESLAATAQRGEHDGTQRTS